MFYQRDNIAQKTMFLNITLYSFNRVDAIEVVKGYTEQ